MLSQAQHKAGISSENANKLQQLEWFSLLLLRCTWTPSNRTGTAIDAGDDDSDSDGGAVALKTHYLSLDGKKFFKKAFNTKYIDF